MIDTKDEEILRKAEQCVKNQSLRQYLADTDWYEIRAISGKPIPEDIKQKRQEARDGITPLETE